MPTSADNPTQHVFKCRLTPQQDWLGSIVSSCQDPSASSTLSSTSLSSLASNVPITTGSDFLLQISATRDPALRSRLSRLFDVENSGTSPVEVDVPTPSITYRRLGDPKKILDELITRPEIAKELLDMLPLGREAYIVVGVVEIDSVSTNGLEKTSRSLRGISLPVADIARAVAGLPVTLYGIGDIELSPMRTSSSYFWNSGAGEGRETIAMEFRAVRELPNDSQALESGDVVERGGELEILDEAFLGYVAGPSVGWDPYTKIKYHFSDKDTG